MNTYHFITTPFGKVMHRVACTLSLVLALIVLSLSMHAGTVQVRLIENLRSWCNQSGACADLPAYFQGIDLKVYSDKSAGAREAVASLAHPPLSKLLSSPSPRVTEVRRAASLGSPTSKGRSIKGMDAK